MSRMNEYYCEYCQAPLHFEKGNNVVICKYCNHINEKEADPETADLLEQAAALRNEGLFDEAKSAYKKLLIKSPESYKAHWGLLLCKYGVAYVERKGGKRVVTCRKRVTSDISEETGYKIVMEHAPESEREQFLEDIQAISAIQNKINEYKNYECDIFICYKETSDGDHGRTQDSYEADFLYQILTTKDGYKVFFARESLKDKAGADYEALIFRAIESAEIMIVLGTTKEYFESTWVKSEWSRYLDLINRDANKTIISLMVRGRDLPEKLSSFEAINLIDDKKDWYSLLRFNIHNRLQYKYKFDIDDTAEHSEIYKEMLDEGCALYLDGDIEKAMAAFRKAAKAGNDVAMYMLGCFQLCKENAGKEDEKKAFEYFNRAAYLGNKDAQDQLAFMYEFGVGVEKNVFNSRIWKKRAEENK